MKKENVIDLAAYRDAQQRQSSDVPASQPMSDELKSAIEELIDRMRSPEPGKESR